MKTLFFWGDKITFYVLWELKDNTAQYPLDTIGLAIGLHAVFF